MGGWHLHPFHLWAVWLDGPYHACCPHHLNRGSVLQEQPHCGCCLLLLLLLHPCAEPAQPRPCFRGHSRNRPGVPLGTTLLLKPNQPRALAKLSASYSEGELLHHTPNMITHLGLPSPPGVPPPCRAKPSERVRLQTLVEACSFSAPSPLLCKKPLQRGY